MAHEDVRERAVRNEEPAPVNDRQPVLERANVVLAAQRALQPDGRALAEPDSAVAADRVFDLQAPKQRLRVVVRHVEVREVHPHLECVDRRVAHRGAWGSERERGGGGP